MPAAGHDTPRLFPDELLELSFGTKCSLVPPEAEAVETSSNASIGDLNGDGYPDIVLVKGRHWQVTSLIFFCGTYGDPRWLTRNAAVGDLNGDG